MPVGDYFRKIFGGPFRKETDMGDGSHAERVIAVPPTSMVSGNRLQVDIQQPAAVTLPAAMVNANRLKVEVDDPIEVNLPNALISGGGIAGISPRIRVDPGQTGFFAGRMFRTYIETVIPVAGPAVSFRFTSSKDFILWTQLLELTQGALRLEVFTGAVTPSGSWTQLPIIGVNRMAERPTPLYVPVATAETGGSFTGGTAVDLILIRSGSNQGSNSSQNTGGERSERGLPAGTYYGRLSTLTGGVAVADAAQGIYSITWEERP